MNQPQEDELRSEIAQTRDRLSTGEWYPANTFKLDDDFESLGLLTVEERLNGLRAAADEIGPHDSDHVPPPGTADEPVCRGARMRAFVWNSAQFRCLMYFKFAWKNGNLFIFSLHRADFAKKPVRDSRQRPIRRTRR